MKYLCMLVSETKCWCGCKIDEKGKHLNLKENSLSGSTMKKDAEGKIIHLKGYVR